MSTRQLGSSTDIQISAGHGDLTVSSSLDALSKAVQDSRIANVGQASATSFQGMSLEELRRRARQSAVQLASLYTAAYRSLDASFVERADRLSQYPIIMGGHQPDLFHCGVWLKNFLLSQLAKRCGGTAIHFLVDNDLCRSTAINVPVRTSEGWMTRAVAYDCPRAPTPWESCTLVDLSCWNSFHQRVRHILPAIGHEPILDCLWEYARQDAQPGKPLGNLLSQARHLFERDLGLETLEVPLSHLVSTPEFGCFSLTLFERLPLLHAIYNDQLKRYREKHKIRNHAQPIPDLGQSDQWLEAPWWCHRRGSCRRDPLWIKVSNSAIELSNRDDWQWSLEPPANQESAIEQWTEISNSGMLLRPRALLTTMYARLILSDLFIHGTGGARYDQLTDCIIAEFFKVEPPPVGMATATLHLPLVELSDDLTRPVGPLIEELQRRMRIAQSNPESIFDSAPIFDSDEFEAVDPASGDFSSWQAELNSLTDRKRLLLEQIPPKGQKWEWHSEIKLLNNRLKELAAPKLTRMQQKIEHLTQLVHQQEIVLSREYSFCLFPRDVVLSVFNQIPESDSP
jgi:hypothetical protein